MARMSPIGNRILPYQAGVARLTPLSVNKTPMWERSVTTPFNFLASTQHTVSTTYETVENGNGQSKSLPTQETHTFTITDNAYSPIFHNAALGMIETLYEKALMPRQFTHTLPTTVPEGGTLDITFGTDKDQTLEPAADKNGEFHFVVNDNKGNVLTKATQAVLGTFTYDADTKTLSFSEDYKGMALTITYDYEETDVVEYSSNPVLQSREYLIETFGLVVEAETDEKYLVYRSLERATLTGDTSSQPTQQSRSSSITYTFTSAPVPTGVSIYRERMAVYKEADATDGLVTDSIVNGCDDDFNFTDSGSVTD